MMMPAGRAPETLRIDVTVQSRSSRRGIQGYADGRLRVRTTAPPVGGKANEDVRKLLAAAYGVPRSQVRLVRGAGARRKTFEIDDPARLPDFPSLDNRGAAGRDASPERPG